MALVKKKNLGEGQILEVMVTIAMIGKELFVKMAEMNFAELSPTSAVIRMVINERMLYDVMKAQL